MTHPNQYRGYTVSYGYVPPRQGSEDWKTLVAAVAHLFFSERLDTSEIAKRIGYHESVADRALHEAMEIRFAMRLQQ